MSLEDDLEKVISSPGTKSDRARALFALGCERTDVVELLGMSYSQAHSIWKGLQNGTAPVARATSVGTHPSRLNLGPTQTRIATQDGHEVLRDLDGVRCRSCDETIIFSLAYLAFVHTHSKKEPTNLEDSYAN